MAPFAGPCWPHRLVYITLLGGLWYENGWRSEVRGRAQGEVVPCLDSAREFSGPHGVGRGEGLPSARKGSEANASPCPSSEAGRDWMDSILHSASTRDQPEVTNSKEVAVGTQGCPRFPGTPPGCLATQAPGSARRRLEPEGLTAPAHSAELGAPSSSWASRKRESPSAPPQGAGTQVQG